MYSSYRVRCKREFDGRVVWVCMSYWSRKYGTSRTRTEHARRTAYYTLAEARRWARKYKVECPTEPE